MHVKDSIELLKKAVAKGVSLKRIPPLLLTFKAVPASTLAGTALGNVEVNVEVNPLLAASWELLGATKSGARSWKFSAPSETVMEGFLETVLESSIYDPDTINSCIEKASLADSYSNIPWTSFKGIFDFLDHSARKSYYVSPSASKNTGTSFNAFSYKRSGHPWKTSVISVHKTKKDIHIKVITDHLELNGFKLNLLPYNSSPPGAKLFTSIEALAIKEKAESLGYLTADNSTAFTLQEVSNYLETRLILQKVPGSFGEARVIFGGGIKGMTGFSTPKAIRHEILPLDEAIEQVNTWNKKAKEIIISKEVDELFKMHQAKFVDYEHLRPYQSECVGLMKATTCGLVNACAPGLGKTIMTAVGLKEDALEKGTEYRALVVVPAIMRSQWKAELKEWFSAAHVQLVSTSKEVQTALDALEKDTESPQLIVVSYDIATSNKDLFKTISWDALVVDEAAILKSNSNRTAALWELRTIATKAFALTGTPIDKSVTDLVKITSWARNDKVEELHAFTKANKHMSKPALHDSLRTLLGPTLFRKDRSEIASELPSISTEIVRIDPSPAEKALANAARNELEAVYEKLLRKLEDAKALAPSDPRIKTAADELAKIRGGILGGITLARMAATDPQAVKDSSSSAATLLNASGLVDKAVKSGGTKRKHLVELTVDLAGRGEKVLLFTDFSSVAANLAADLKKAGVAVGTIMGGQNSKSRDAAAVDFMSNRLDVLVLTSAAQEGLNLQAASVLVHVDLPWVPSAVVQRIGRASRIGSKSRHLSVLIPLMADTVEERVAAVLIPRAMVAMSALDSGRVEDVRSTELGMALAGLAEVTTFTEADNASMGLLEMAKEILKK